MVRYAADYVEEMLESGSSHEDIAGEQYGTIDHVYAEIKDIERHMEQLQSEIEMLSEERSFARQVLREIGEEE